MPVNLDQIEFYHGPPCQKSRSTSSLARGKQSSISSVAEPIRRALAVQSVVGPESPTFTLSPSRLEPPSPTLQSHEQLSTSTTKPCNVFDMELASFHDGIEGPWFENTAPGEGNGSYFSNGEICPDDLGLRTYGNGILSGGAVCHPHPELEQNIVTTDEQIPVQAPLDLPGRPSCLLEQIKLDGLAASTLSGPGKQLDQVSQDQRRDRTAVMVDTDDSRPSRASSVSCDVVPRGTSNTPYNLCASRTSRGEPDTPASPHTSTVESSRQDLAVTANHGTTRSVSLDDTEDRSHRRTTRSRIADCHEQSQETSGSSSSSQVTTRSAKGRSSPEGQITDRPKQYPSIAVVVPAPPWKRARVARSTTRATTPKQVLHQGQGRGNNNCAKRPCFKQSSEPQYQKKRSKRRRFAAGPVSCHLGDSLLSDCAFRNQNILGRAILTVQSDGSKPAYFFTFMPQNAPVSLEERPPHRHSRNNRSISLRSGRQRLYSSEENALLVRLKEREKMSWTEITEYFPGRSTSSLQVHYSTKLRHKRATRS